MKIDKGDITGFALGIITSIIASWMWDSYMERKKKLNYSDKKIIEEMKSEIQGLKRHINNKIA